MSLLDKAKEVVDLDRQSQYGDPVVNAEAQAQIASIIIGRPISALDCNAVNLAQKIVRMGRNPSEDTFVDVLGYTEIRHRLHEKTSISITTPINPKECDACFEPPETGSAWCHRHKPKPTDNGECNVRAG